MNIMFLIFSFNTGGIERLLIDMCNHMTSKGNHVWLAIINKDYETSLLDCLDPSVHVIRMDRPISTGLFHYMLQLSAIVHQNHIDILHCQGMNCVLFSLIAKLRNPHTVVLNTVHDTGNYPSYSSMKIFLSNRILSQTIAISDSVRREILARGVSPKKVITIYNAIDTRKFQYQTSTVPVQKTNWRISNVARFYPEKKGQDTLINAIMHLVPDYPEISCTFAGAIYKGQQQEFEKITRQIESAGLTEHFHFLGNIEDVPALLRRTDIFVLPSNYEGFGISLIEAMAMGIPCVGSDLEGPAEIFNLAQEDGVNVGCLAAVGNANNLAEQIRYCIDNYARFDHAAIADFARKHFDITQNVERHLNLYSNLLGRK